MRKPKTSRSTSSPEVGGIGERLREVRGAQTQDEFSEAVGVPKRTLVRYEAGVTYPTADTLAKICAKFNVDPRWLLFGEGPVQRFFFQRMNRIPNTA